MKRRLLCAFALLFALGASNEDELDFSCPKGSVLRKADRDAACETRSGVGEGPFWARRTDGSLRIWGTAHAGKTEGTWLSFHPSGARSIEAQYVGGRLVGPFRMWNDAGRLIYAGTHDQAGEMDGTWARWWPNGVERVRWEMRHGRAYGPVSAWWESGGKKFHGQREEGLREGTWVWWSESGVEIAHCRFEHDVVVEGACGTFGPD
jgi:antitoxin component YwqK of YwqJK toxin-antitoxin module